MIPMNDFTAEPPALKEAMRLAVARVIGSGSYVLGEEVRQFERNWAARCGCAHGVGVGNGMDAIEVGLRASGIGHGAEVVTTPMTAFATVLAVIRSGATPVLADIRPDTALLDMDSVDRCITGRTRAVVLVHLYGQLPDMTAWQTFCRQRGLALIEDCAQAHLAEWKGGCAGTFGIFGAYSFYPTKNLGALGDGGMVVTQDAALAAAAARLRNYGQSGHGRHPVLGLNSRLDELQAALLNERMAWLDDFTRARRRVVEAYVQGIRHGQVQTMARPASPAAHVHHLFVLTSDRRDDLRAHLAARGVQSGIHFPLPAHHQESCAGLRRDPRGLPAAEAHARRCLSVPCHPFLTDAQIGTVIDAVNSFA